MENKAVSFCRHVLSLGFGAVMTTLLGAGTAHAGCSITRVSSWTYAANGLMASETLQPTVPVGSITNTSCAGVTAATATTTTTYAYDAYGNKISASVSGSDSANSQDNVPARETDTTYDAQGEFATTIKNTLGQTETWAYDPRFGVPLDHTGPNGLSTYWYYDSLGRKTSEWRADGTLSVWNYYYATNYPLQAYYISESGYYYSSATGFMQIAPAAITYYDALGRPTTKFTEAYQTANGSTSLSWASMATTYDVFGRVASADTVPVFSTNPTSYTYDALGRPKTASMPGAPGTLLKQYTYNGLATSMEVFSSYTSSSSNIGETTTTTNNAEGLPVSVKNTNGYTTTYSYDAVGDLLSITDPKNNVTNYTYDSEGRKLTMADPDRGNWTYAYDALGEVLSTISPKEAAAGTKTSFQYDALGRMVERTQPDQTDMWTYNNDAQSSCPAYQGSTSACVGKLASEASYTTINSAPGTLISERTLTYDTVGRPVVTATQPTAASPSYSFTTAYNDGLINTVTYPSGYQVQYGYNGLGTMSSLTCAANCTAGASTALWTLNTTNAAGQVLAETYGNGVSVQNTYGAYINGVYNANGDLLTGTQAGGSSAPTAAGNFSYSYDDLGNLTARQDADLNLSESFTYDPLYRLTGDSLTGASTSNVSVSYDQIGNIISKSDVGNYSYGTASGPHAVMSISCTSGTACAAVDNINTTYAYDADGNTLSGNGYTTAWTSYDMAATASQGTTSFAYTYDADHNRITQTQSTSGTPVNATDYINDAASGQHAELASSGIWTDYLFIGQELLGIHITQPSVNANGPCASSTAVMCNRFFVRDHLGSVAVVTDDGGNLLERDLYDPWGKRRNANGSPDINNTVTSKTTRGFTGQEMVQNGAGFELVNLNARLYDPTIGRFLSTDPQLPKAGAQADLINPYSYCDNNPLSITDPTGQSFLGILGAIVGIIVAVVFQVYLPQLEALAFGGAATAYESGAYAMANAAIVGSISGGADSAVASGGNLGAALQGLGVGAATAAEFSVVGTFTDGGANSLLGDTLEKAGMSTAEATATDYLAQVAGDGLVGGLSSAAAGGSFQSGFLAAGFSAAVSPYVLHNGGALSAYNVTAEAITGGIGSVLGGGSFEDGVMTGAFRYLFNECASGKCWTTSAEGSLAASGNYSGYYKLACADGDAYACQAGQIASGQGFWSWATTIRLRVEDDLWGSVGLNGTNMNSIRSALALGYANYLPDSQAQAIVPSASAIAEIHWQVFGAFGIPPSAFGGTPFAGDVPFAASNGTMFTHGIIMGGQGWCPNCGP